MMRAPVGSRAPPGSAARNHPATYVFGTVVVSMTRIDRRGGSAEKYAAAAATSPSVADLASAIISVVGNRFGTEVPRAPLLKSAICWTM